MSPASWAERKPPPGTLAAPRHRLSVARRGKALDLRRRPPRGGAPLHLRADELDGAGVAPIAD